MKILNMFWANLKMDFKLTIRYLPNAISEVLIFYLIFIGFFYGITLVGNPESIDYNIQMVILNYIFWFLILTVTQGLGWDISNEASQGTLEQLYITPFPFWLTIFFRILSTIIINIVTITVLLFAAMITSNQWLNLDLLSIVPITIVTLIGVMGIGFILAGITLVFKQVDHILQLFQFVIMAMTFVPITIAPILKYAPFMFGLHLIRDIGISNVSIINIPLNDLIFLILNSTIYFLLGLFLFKKSEKVAKQKGLFGHY